MIATPLISVVIPTHDRLEMLREAVASVTAQAGIAREAVELVIVDDGSTDGTWDWLEARPCVSVRLPARGGPSAARNRGVEAASGDLVAFLDSDDLFLPHKLQRQARVLRDNPGLALCHSNEIWRRGDRELKQLKKHEKRGGWIFEHCLPMCRISPSAAVIRRRVLRDLGGFDEELEVAEDYELWLRLTCQHEVGFIEEPLIIKRGGHADQLSEKYGQIEKFRIEALRRVLLRAPLSKAQRAAAQGTLERKCEIHARGCEKRGRGVEAARYRELPARLGAPPLCPQEEDTHDGTTDHD